jgi:hypothetical protein
MPIRKIAKLRKIVCKDSLYEVQRAPLKLSSTLAEVVFYIDLSSSTLPTMIYGFLELNFQPEFSTHRSDLLLPTTMSKAFFLLTFEISNLTDCVLQCPLDVIFLIIE